VIDVHAAPSGISKVLVNASERWASVPMRYKLLLANQFSFAVGNMDKVSCMH